MATGIFLLCCGRTAWDEEGRLLGRKDVPLSSRGREDAERAAAGLASVEFSDILASPLNRAVETAEIVGRGQGVARDPRLTEVDWCDDEGRILGESCDSDPLLRAFERLSVGGEALHGVAARVQASIEHSVADNPDDSQLLFVSHPMAIRLALAALLGMSNGGAMRVYVAPGGLCRLSFDERRGEPQLLTLNWGSTALNPHPDFS